VSKTSTLTLHNVAVKVSLAESLKRSGVGFCPCGKRAELDAVVAHGFGSVGGFLLQEELAEGFVPFGNGEIRHLLCRYLVLNTLRFTESANVCQVKTRNRLKPTTGFEPVTCCLRIASTKINDCYRLIIPFISVKSG
jgi:hypothetical protein